MCADRYKVLREARRVHGSLPSVVDGLCAVAAARLHSALKDVGVHSTFLVTENPDFSHVFLKVPNVDGQDMLLYITSSQFVPGAYVEFHPLEGLDTKKFDWWHDPQEVSTPEELLHLQQEAGWPEDQHVGAIVERTEPRKARRLS